MEVMISADAVVAALQRVAAHLIGMKDLLNGLDAAMGDGDTGISAAKGAEGVQQYLQSNVPDGDLGKFLAQVGMTFNRIAPSTMGTLIATGLMRAGKVAAGRADLDGPTLAQMLLAADAGIQERGKARPGDKTIVDTLHPAAEAFAAAIDRGETLPAAAQAMLAAARAGRDAVIPLRSKIGRAGWVGERTANHPDPGTVLLVQALETALQTDYSEPGSTLTG